MRIVAEEDISEKNNRVRFNAPTLLPHTGPYRCLWTIFKIELLHPLLCLFQAGSPVGAFALHRTHTYLQYEVVILTLFDNK